MVPKWKLTSIGASPLFKLEINMDYHTHTWKKDKQFRRFMNKMTWFTWHFWRARRKRDYAKTYNHARVYGGSISRIYYK